MSKYYLFLFCAFIANLSAIAQNDRKGSIAGTVTTADGKPAAGVTVTLGESKKATITNDNGRFVLRNITPGQHTIEITLVGYSPLVKTIEVEADKVTTEEMQVTLSHSELQEVIVKAARQPYKVSNPSESLRLNQELIEVPQNIQVITNEVLKDQQILKMTDGVLRNVSGAVRWEGVGDLYAVVQMRGQWIGAFRNGFNIASGYGPLNEDMAIVDRIEFVKGPAGFLLANGDPGGSYNVVTKKPTGQTKGEASFTMGSFDLYRASIDLDGKLSKDEKLLYRFNAAIEKSGSFKDYLFNDRYLVAPVLAYRFNDNTQLTLEYTYQRAKMSQFFGSSSFSPKGFATLPRSFTFDNPGFEPARINDHSVFANLQHKLNDQWKFTAQLGFFKYTQSALNFDPEEVREDGTVIRGIGSWDAASEMSLGQAFINGDFNTGQVQHKFLAGVDAGKKNYLVDFSQWHTLDTDEQPFDVNDPYYGEPANGYPVFDHSTPLKVRAVASGGVVDERFSSIYVQDQLGFFDSRLRVTLAARYTDTRQVSWGEPGYQSRRLTPRVGVSYSVTPDFAIYGVYDQAFLPQSGLLRNSEKVKPITGSNTEFGLKKDWLNKSWNTTVSVYRIIKRNELTDDPFNGPDEFFSIVMGETQAKGIEIDVRGKIARGLSVVANYAYTQSKVTKVTNGVTWQKVGDVIPGYAAHTVNSWFDYDFSDGPLKNFGVSTGVSSLLERETSWEYPETGGGKLPDYFRWDGGISWKRNGLGVSFNIYNILDKYLYSGSYTAYLNSYFWIAEPPRNVRLNFSVAF